MLLWKPPEIDESSKAVSWGVVLPAEAEVHVLDLEQPPIREIGAEGRENTGTGRSVHIHNSKGAQKRVKHPSKLGRPTNNPVCTRIIRSPPKRNAEARSTSIQRRWRDEWGRKQEGLKSAVMLASTAETCSDLCR